MQQRHANKNTGLHSAHSLPAPVWQPTHRSPRKAGQLQCLWLAATALIGTSWVHADTCSQADIMLTKQEKVDQFQADYGPCDEITGDLTIVGFTFLGTDINTLAPLNDIARIGGNLTLQYLSNLPGVDGLSLLTEVGGNLIVNANFPMTHLDGLIGLEIVHGEIHLENLSNLDSIAGLGALVSIGGDFTIGSAGKLQGLSGFPPAITHLPGGLSLIANPDLDDVSALSNLIHVGGSLLVSDNSSLHQLTGLDAVESVGENLTVRGNPALVDCTSLLTVLDQEDDGLTGPGPGPAGIPDIGGSLQLQGNRPVCNDRDTIGDLLSASGFE
jgi:hypothetical protein